MIKNSILPIRLSYDIVIDENENIVLPATSMNSGTGGKYIAALGHALQALHIVRTIPLLRNINDTLEDNQWLPVCECSRSKILGYKKDTKIVDNQWYLPFGDAKNVLLPESSLWEEYAHYGHTIWVRAEDKENIGRQGVPYLTRYIHVIKAREAGQKYVNATIELDVRQRGYPGTISNGKILETELFSPEFVEDIINVEELKLSLSELVVYRSLTKDDLAIKGNSFNDYCSRI